MATVPPPIVSYELSHLIAYIIVYPGKALPTSKNAHLQGRAREVGGGEVRGVGAEGRVGEREGGRRSCGGVRDGG